MEWRGRQAVRVQPLLASLQLASSKLTITSAFWAKSQTPSPPTFIIDAGTAPVSLHSRVGPVQVPRLIEPLHEGVRHQGLIRLPWRRCLPLPTGRRSASGLSASSRDAHHGLLLEQRELIRHAFLLLHACRVFRSVSLYPGVRPFPVVPSPVPGPPLTSPCPSNTIADAVVRSVRDPRRIRPAASPCGRRPSIRCLFVGAAIPRLQLPADPAPRRAPLPSAGLSGSAPPLPVRDAHYRHR